MNEYLSEAFEELKRADHLIYVSLKYTRTVDGIKSIIERLINAYDEAMTVLLEKAKEDGKIESYSKNAGIKCNEVKALYPDNKDIQAHMEFYLLLRKITRSEYKKIEEYRRHVAMIVQLDQSTIISIDIDRVKEYYDRADAFVKSVAEICGGIEPTTYYGDYF